MTHSIKCHLCISWTIYWVVKRVRWTCWSHGHFCSVSCKRNYGGKTLAVSWGVWFSTLQRSYCLQRYTLNDTASHPAKSESSATPLWEPTILHFYVTCFGVTTRMLHSVFVLLMHGRCPFIWPCLLCIFELLCVDFRTRKTSW